MGSPLWLLAIFLASVRGFSLWESLAGSNPFQGPKNQIQELWDRPRSTEPDFSVYISNLDSNYAMRITEVDPSKLGIDTTKQYSGYLDYQSSKHFFYWSFESRNDPENDPVILWLNGGPGCSSLTGLFFELGPSSIGPDLKPIHNPYSWNNNATVIFLDQPIGVGFSWGDDKITTTNAAGKDVYIFLDLFFQKFPHLRSNDFHIAGESYAGHYIPEIAHEIAVVNEHHKTFNLTSVLIGNGFTDPLVQYDYYEPMACGEGGHKAVISEEECAKMRTDMPRCATLNQACYSTGSTFACIAAAAYCERMAMTAYGKTKLNVYDIRSKCEDEEGDTCYKGIGYVEEYLNQPAVQATLGSDVSKFKGCNDEVFLSFELTGDSNRPFQQYVAELVNRDIPVLIYAGDKDFICNWLGNKAWIESLVWKHQGQFASLPLKPWISRHTKESLGEVKTFGSLTFLRVFDAGHMVPFNQPENSLEMINRWLAGDYELGYKY
ncbi:LAFA_0E14994g1_1 [Lachancea sp. 'fantastica']|nr:LAFA_0E14994g1_1 [Lachancea sp. 'fantastica']